MQLRSKLALSLLALLALAGVLLTLSLPTQYRQPVQVPANSDYLTQDSPITSLNSSLPPSNDWLLQPEGRDSRQSASTVSASNRPLRLMRWPDDNLLSHSSVIVSTPPNGFVSTSSDVKGYVSLPANCDVERDVKVPGHHFIRIESQERSTSALAYFAPNSGVIGRVVDPRGRGAAGAYVAGLRVLNNQPAVVTPGGRTMWEVTSAPTVSTDLRMRDWEQYGKVDFTTREYRVAATAATNAYGYFLLSTDSRGPYKLIAEGQDGSFGFLLSDTRAEGSPLATITLGDHRSIPVRVQSEDKSGLSAALVQVRHDPESDACQAQLITDRAGVTSVPVPPWETHLVVSKPGFVSRSMVIPVDGRAESSAGEIATVELQSVAPLCFSVVGERGTAVDSAQVVVRYLESGHVLGGLLSNKFGRLLIPRTSDASEALEITVAAPGYRERVVSKTFFPGREYELRLLPLSMPTSTLCLSWALDSPQGLDEEWDAVVIGMTQDGEQFVLWHGQGTPDELICVPLRGKASSARLTVYKRDDRSIVGASSAVFSVSAPPAQLNLSVKKTSIRVRIHERVQSQEYELSLSAWPSWTDSGMLTVPMLIRLGPEHGDSALVEASIPSDWQAVARMDLLRGSARLKGEDVHASLVDSGHTCTLDVDAPSTVNVRIQLSELCDVALSSVHGVLVSNHEGFSSFPVECLDNSFFFPSVPFGEYLFVAFSGQRSAPGEESADFQVLYSKLISVKTTDGSDCFVPL